MGKILIIKNADFSAVGVGQITPPTPTNAPVITISTSGTVTISASGATAIYYTTDGSIPTKNSNRYTTTFNVSNGTTVKAIAEFASGSTSGVSSKTYVSVGGQWLRGYSDETLTEGNKLRLGPNADWTFITSEDSSKVFTKIKFYAVDTGDIIFGGKTYTVNSPGINTIELSPSIEGKDFTIRTNIGNRIIGINADRTGFSVNEHPSYYLPIDVYYE